MECWLAQFRPDVPCDGRLVRCHLIPRQQMRLRWHEYHHGVTGWDKPDGERRPLPFKTLKDAIDDERSWVPGCGGLAGNAGHHGMLDTARTLRIPSARLPLRLWEFAEELGLTWWLEREYGMPPAEAVRVVSGYVMADDGTFREALTVLSELAVTPASDIEAGGTDERWSP